MTRTPAVFGKEEKNVEIRYPGCAISDYMSMEEFLSYSESAFPHGSQAFVSGRPVSFEKKFKIVDGKIVKMRQ